MNIKYKTLVAAIAGATIVAGLILPVAMPGQTKVYAKWVNETSNQNQQEPDKAAAEPYGLQLTAQKDSEMPDEVLVVGGQPEPHGIQSEQADIVKAAIDQAITEALDKKVKVTIPADKRNQDKVDVGPGVEGLDYDKVVKWQQNVDAGRELWRLDPLAVAKMEGKSYGFSDDDTYTIIRKLNSSTIARHGQIDIEVNHDGKRYTMIIVRPFGGRDAIWTTYRVVGQKPPVVIPAPSSEERVLFQVFDKFYGWKWQKGSYPKDMAFAIVADYESQLQNDQRIPEAALLKLKDVDLSKKVALFAYLGSLPGGHGIGIEKVTMSGNHMTVLVRTKSPRPSDMVTMMVTYPADFVLIDRSVVDVWGGVTVTFVDQQGQVLSKNKITITHH